MSVPNDVLIFDLFGVIAEHQSQAGKDTLLTTAGAHAADFWPAYWAQRPPYDRGEIGGPHYWAAVAERLGVNFDHDRIEQLIQHDISSWSRVDDQMVAMLEDLSSTRRLALLSNIPPESGQHFLKQHRWLDLFEVRGLSYQIGHAKPERETYEWCIRELGVEPPQALFVDDRHENIRAAEKVGLRGHLFTSREALRQTLESDITRRRTWPSA
jgi:putative hydrolase of the HAD superfamily